MNIKVFNLMSRLMKQDTYNFMKLVSVNLDLMQMSVIINNAGMKINAGVNVKN